jgi:hypothetical protein
VVVRRRAGMKISISPCSSIALGIGAAQFVLDRNNNRLNRLSQIESKSGPGREEYIKARARD